MALFEATRFPFERDWGTRLYRLLVTAYSAAPAIRRLVDAVPVPHTELAWDRPVVDVWHQVLERAAGLGVLRKLVTDALSDPAIAAHHRALATLVEEGDALPAPAPPLAGGRGPVMKARPVPSGTVDRPDLVDDIVRLLLAGPDTGSSATVGHATALRGAGGFGKTRLATLVCARPGVRQHFRDGIVWVTLGEQVAGPDLAGKVTEVCEWLTGQRPSVTDPAVAGSSLGDAFVGRHLLLVIDDVWSRMQLEPFMVGGPGVTRLITTRLRGVLPRNCSVVDVNAMTDGQARELLTAGLDPLPGRVLDRLLDATGRWPVLLDLVNGYASADVRDGGSAEESLAAMLDHLVTHGPDLLDVADPDQRGAAVTATLDRSLRRLTPEQLGLYEDLAVFPEDADIPRSILERYWAPGHPASDVHQFCRLLAELSLVQEYRLDPPRVRMHDVIRVYLIHRVGDDLPRRHAALLDSHREGPGWSELPDDNRYLWSWLGYHLHCAGRDDELAETLHQARYLAAKLHHLGPGGIEAELGYLTDPVSVELLAGIQQAAHLLAPLEPAGSLEATLASRLAHRPVLAGIVADLYELTGHGKLRPFAPMPDAPSPALKRVLVGGDRLVAVAPDGKWLAAPDIHGTVRVWETGSGREIHSLPGHREVRRMGVAPDGSWLVTAGTDADVSRDGDWPGDDVLIVWTLDGRARSHKLVGSSGTVSALVVTPDGRVVTGDSGGVIMIWDPLSGELLDRMVDHGAGISALAVPTNGSWLASAEGDDFGAGNGVVRIRDLRSGHHVRDLASPARWIRALAASGDGRWLASVEVGTYQDRDSVSIWDMTAGRQVGTIPGRRGDVSALVFAGDGSWLAFGEGPRVDNRESVVQVWEPLTGNELGVLRGFVAGVSALVAGPGGTRLTVADWDGRVTIWDSRTWSCAGALSGHTSGVAALAVGPGAGWLASVGGTPYGSGDHTVRMWELDSNLGGENGVIGSAGVSALAFSPDRGWLATAGSSGTVSFWNSATGARTHSRPGLDRWTACLVASPDGSWLACAGLGSSVLILPVDEKLGAHSIAVSHGEVRAMAVAPDGSWLATVGREAYAAQPSEPLVRLWDPRTGVVLVTLRGHTDDGTCLAVAPDGSWIASADAGGTILICDPRTGRQRHRISAHSGAVTALVVAPDGSWLASAGGPVWGHGDGAVRVWDPSNGKQLQSWSDDGGLMWTLAVSRDGRRLASCGRDGVIRVWDPTSGADIDRFVGPASSVADVSFTADGTALVAVVENVVQIWPFDRSTGPAALRVDGQLRHLGIVRDGVVVAGDHGPYWLRWT